MLANSNRKLRVLLICGVVPLLIAARNTVTPLPQTMIAAETGPQVGQTVTVRKDDVVLRAKIYETEVVTVDEPISVSVAKFSDEIGQGDRLTPVLSPAKIEYLTGASGRFYCGRNQRTRSGFAEAMIGDWFSKYEVEVRFCFVDSNDDGKLDKYFLSGAKDPADQGARDIVPVPYTTKYLQPDEREGTVELKVLKFKPKTNQILFRLSVFRKDVPEYFTYILTVDGDTPKNTYPDFKTNPKKVPYPVYFRNILGAEIVVMRVDSVKEEAEIRILRHFQSQLFKPIEVKVQYIYIYV